MQWISIQFSYISYFLKSWKFLLKLCKYGTINTFLLFSKDLNSICKLINYIVGNIITFNKHGSVKTLSSKFRKYNSIAPPFRCGVYHNLQQNGGLALCIVPDRKQNLSSL